MPHKDDAVRLQHMLDAAKKIAEFVKAKNRKDLDRDEKLAFALIRLLEIIGEAAKGVSDASRKSHPEIPWKEMTGTRDRLIHGYFDVDLDIVWQIVTVDIPKLVTVLEKITEPPK